MPSTVSEATLAPGASSPSPASDQTSSRPPHPDDKDSDAGREPDGPAAKAENLDALCWLHVLRALPDRDSLLAARQLSRRLRELADLVLQERFVAAWRVAGVAAPPPAAPAYAAARASSFVLCHALQGRDTLAALAVRHGTDVTALKRLNNLLSDGALASRTRLYVPVADAAAAAEGKRVAWLVDEHSRRRLIVIEGPGGLPGVDGGGGGDGSAARRRGAPPGLVVEKLAAVLQRALRIDAETARFYVTSARCDVRAAMEKYEEDRRWERCMRRRGPRLRLP